MGWNSYDAFGSSVTEDEFLANATYVRERLKQHGWQYVVVDFRWSDPCAAQYDPNGIGGPLEADEFGRLIPAVNRFPSAAGGKGFGPLAEKVHAMGLKFGIHVMRGIPRQTVTSNTLIEGSHFRSSEAADESSICEWCKDMFGVKGASPAGQAWYDSIFRQYARWGVDFVKVDDLSFPYYAEEIEAVRRAINNCGRPMVLSLSPGSTPIEHAEHVSRHANMWRIKGDLWDRWTAVREMFELLATWTPHRGAGHWPDADMLPLGKLGIRCEGGPRMSHLTRDEQVTLMTLSCIARSPLMFGGNLPDNDDFTLKLITNDEVLSVNQASGNNRQLWHHNDTIVWTADVPGTGARYVAMFNVSEQPTAMDVNLDLLGLQGSCNVRDLWRGVDLTPVTGQYSAEVPAHGAVLVKIGN